MTILRDALQWIAELAEAGQKVAVLPFLDEKGNRLISSVDGPESVATPSDPIRLQADGVESFCTLVADLPASFDYPPQPTVFVGRESIVGVRDLRHRRDRVTLELETTDALDCLDAHAKGGPLKHREFLRFLRHKMPNLDEFRATISRVEFSRLDDGMSSAGAGKASYGRSVESSVKGTGELPETIAVIVPIYECADLHGRAIACALECDSETQTFQLIPLAGEIDKAKDSVLAAVAGAIASLLEEDHGEISVVRGRPE